MLHIETFGGAPVPSVAQLIFNKTVCLPVSRVPLSKCEIHNTDRFVSNSQKSGNGVVSELYHSETTSAGANTSNHVCKQRESVARALSLPFRDLWAAIVFILRSSDLRTHSLCAVRIDQENKHSRRVSATRQGG
jgi:hypothetical protein